MKQILAPIFAVLVLLAAVLPAAPGRCVPAPRDHGRDATHEASGERAHAGGHADEHADTHAHAEEHAGPTSTPEQDPCACHCSEFPLAAPVATLSLTTSSSSSNPPIDAAITPTAGPSEPRTQMAFFTSSAGPPPGPTRRGRSTRAPPLSS